MNKFIEFYQEIKPKLEKSINKLNQGFLKEENHIIKENLQAFADLNASGKMIRGTLIALGYSFNNQEIDYSIPLATAYELFETSVLVHDDIIDKDNLRRGKQTIHAFNKAKYHNYHNNEHLANSIGICIGDYGYFQANNIITKAYSKDLRLANILIEYNNIVIDTIRGEIIDVVTPFEEQNGIFKGNLEDNTMQIYELKTAWYSIIGPIILGMILGNNTDEEIDDIKKFAMPLGIAFQIQDDLLGIYSDTDNMGKLAGNDIKEFKQTLLYAYTKNTTYYEKLLKHYGKEDYDLQEVQGIFTKSGAKDYCINKMNDLYQEGLDILNNIDWLGDNQKSLLIDFISYLKDRKK